MNIGEANAAATLLYHAAGLPRPGSGPVGAVRAAEAGRFLAQRVHKALDAGPDPERVAAGIEAAAVGRQLPPVVAGAVNALLSFLLDPHAIEASDEEAARYAAGVLADWTSAAGHSEWTPARVAAAWPQLLEGCSGCSTCTPRQDGAASDGDGDDVTAAEPAGHDTSDDLVVDGGRL